VVARHPDRFEVWPVRSPAGGLLPPQCRRFVPPTPVVGSGCGCAASCAAAQDAACAPKVLARTRRRWCRSAQSAEVRCRDGRHRRCRRTGRRTACRRAAPAKRCAVRQQGSACHGRRGGSCEVCGGPAPLLLPHRQRSTTRLFSRCRTTMRATWLGAGFRRILLTGLGRAVSYQPARRADRGGHPSRPWRHPNG